MTFRYPSLQLYMFTPIPNSSSETICLHVPYHAVPNPLPPRPDTSTKHPVHDRRLISASERVFTLLSTSTVSVIRSKTSTEYVPCKPVQTHTFPITYYLTSMTSKTIHPIPMYQYIPLQE